MPVSGLLITLDSCSSAVDLAIANLTAEPRVQLGTQIGPLLPIAVDTMNREEDCALREFIEGLEGVRKVDIVFVGFDVDGDPVVHAAGPRDQETSSAATKGHAI